MRRPPPTGCFRRDRTSPEPAPAGAAVTNEGSRSVASIFDGLTRRRRANSLADRAERDFSRENYESAHRQWLASAAQGSGEACYRLGLLYAFGHGVIRNLPDAVAWYEKGAALGHAKARLELAPHLRPWRQAAPRASRHRQVDAGGQREGSGARGGQPVDVLPQRHRRRGRSGPARSATPATPRNRATTRPWPCSRGCMRKGSGSIATMSRRGRGSRRRPRPASPPRRRGSLRSTSTGSGWMPIRPRRLPSTRRPPPRAMPPPR